MDVERFIELVLLAIVAGGAIAIAIVNYRAEKQRRTLDLIHTATTNESVLSISRRIFVKRRGISDPYVLQTGTCYDYAQDLMCFLNFFETVCIEVNTRAVDRQTVNGQLADYLRISEPLMRELANVSNDFDEAEVRGFFPALVGWNETDAEMPPKWLKPKVKA